MKLQDDVCLSVGQSSQVFLLRFLKKPRNLISLPRVCEFYSPISTKKRTVFSSSFQLSNFQRTKGCIQPTFLSTKILLKEYYPSSPSGGITSGLAQILKTRLIFSLKKFSQLPESNKQWDKCNTTVVFKGIKQILRAIKLISFKFI